MLIKKPEKGTVIYEYYPQWLANSPVGRSYGKHIYYDNKYWNDRLFSGLLYLSEEDVITRVDFEKKRLKHMHTLIKGSHG